MSETRWPIVVEEHAGILVVRDDLIPGGSKRRFVDRLMVGASEVVYASPVYGGAQIAIAHAARELGIRASIFCAKRKTLHPRTLEARAAGANVIEVSPGYLSCASAKAREHCETTGARLLPFGMECQEALEALGEVAREVAAKVGKLDQVWTVGGSGVLSRGLQLGLEASEWHVVQVGRELTATDAGKARVHVHDQPFEANARRTPPFPSCSNYDAKAWEWVRSFRRGRTLFWNVMA